MDQDRRILLTPKLVDSLYVEAMVLADEARSYFDIQAEEDRANLDASSGCTLPARSLRGSRPG
jgi:regulator of CtrA degradation